MQVSASFTPSVMVVLKLSISPSSMSRSFCADSLQSLSSSELRLSTCLTFVVSQPLVILNEFHAYMICVGSSGFFTG